jgi:PAS domain S-box-containing protein
MEPGASSPNGRDAEPGAAGGPAYSRAYREAFHFSPDAQLVTDPSGVVVEANHAAADLLRCQKEFLIGKPLALFSAPGWRQRFYAGITRLTHGNTTDAFATRLARPGGAVREVFVFGWSGDGEQAPERRLYWLVRDVTELHRSELARAELQRRLATAQEDERRRVSRDLHDTVGQTLTALSLSVRAVRDAGPLPEAALARLEQVQRLADELARQLHELAVRLRPTALDDLGLEATVQQLVADWSARTGVPADFQAINCEDRVPPEVETALYRVVQEALTNIAKHAGAGHVSVVLTYRREVVAALVEDDGVGFDVERATQPPAPARPNAGRGRLGLLGMRERVALVGGVLEIESIPERGTTIIARIPLAQPHSHSHDGEPK